MLHTLQDFRRSFQQPIVAPSRADATRPRILLIDDSPTQLAELILLLKDHCEIQVATSGKQGLALAMVNPPDMMLLDVQMPGMDGYDVAKALRECPSARQVPFIFLTLDDTTEAEQRGLDLGATDYVTKPVHGAVALRRILNHLERERLRRQVEWDRALLEDRVRQRTAELECARNDAQAASRLKDAILRNLSHELRTPLNGILGMLDLVRRQVGDDGARRRLALAEQSARRLDDVLMGLLDLAQLEAGIISLNSAVFEIAELVEEVLMPLRAIAASKGLALDLAVDPASRAATLHGDRARVQHILRELVLNAIKFSARGAIRLHAEVVEAPGPAGLVRQVKVTVSDCGPGVDTARVQEIFKPFVQLDASMTRAAEGNGIGLSLVQGLARLMGGQVSLEANGPSGATFALHLPCHRVAGN